MKANPFIVAIPILNPVKLPGPVATAKKSISVNVRFARRRTVSISPSNVFECDELLSPSKEPMISAPFDNATAPASVAVSILRINGSFDTYFKLTSAIANESSQTWPKIGHGDELHAFRSTLSDTAPVDELVLKSTLPGVHPFIPL